MRGKSPISNNKKSSNLEICVFGVNTISVQQKGNLSVESNQVTATN